MSCLSFVDTTPLPPHNMSPSQAPFSSTPAAPERSLRLVASSPQEHRSVLVQHPPAWKGPLANERYVDREYSMMEAITTDHFTCWILTDTPESSQTNGTALSSNNNILSACETTRRAMLMAHNGVVETVGLNSLSNVFTPEHRRGHRYSKKMINSLLGLVAEGKTGKYPTANGPDVSILYSEIGSDFYTHLGWTRYDSNQMKIPASIPTEIDITTDPSYPSVRLLTEQEFPDLVTADCDLTKSLLEAASRAKPNARIVTHIPNLDLLRWFWIREDFGCESLFKFTPQHRGAIVTGPGFDLPGQRVWCYWALSWATPNAATDPTENVIHILRIVVEALPSLSHHEITPESFPDDRDFQKYSRAIGALVHATQKEAGKYNMESIYLWNPNPLAQHGITTFDSRAVLQERKSSSLPFLRWLPDAHKSPGSPPTEVIWIQNDKLGWC